MREKRTYRVRSVRTYLVPQIELEKPKIWTGSPYRKHHARHFGFTVVAEYAGCYSPNLGHVCTTYMHGLPARRGI